MSIIDRIVFLLEEKNMKSVDLCRHIPIKENVFSTWKKRKTDPPAKYILQICDFFDISPYFLLSGKERNPTGKVLSNKELQFIEKFGCLDDISKGKILERMDVMLESRSDEPTCSGNKEAAPKSDAAIHEQKKHLA